MTRRGLLRIGLASAAALNAAPPRQLVLMDQDGGFPDDYLATALLLTMDAVETIGVVVTPADCYLEPAVSATRKILRLMRREDVPLGASRIEGAHPFPAEWRKGSYTMDRLPVLNGRNPIRSVMPSEAGPQFTARLLRAAAAPVTLLVTGPLSTLAAALQIAPEIESKIREIVWMGGALNVPGNVAPAMQSEWNAYWDPPAAGRIWRSRIPIVLCPLDITNHVPVTRQFIERLRAQSRFPVSRLASEAYGKVLGDGSLFFWDLLTTAYIGRPEMFQLREWETVIVTESGRTKLQAGGRRIRALDRVDVDQFYDYLLNQWAR